MSRHERQMEAIEDFYGVYLLYNINPKYKGQTYIGYTRDPNRRLKQHNRGVWAGGAFRTNNRGPWKMVLIVHGFPNNIAALRFEWAWQNPEKTTRLKDVALINKIARKETQYEYCIRILSEMLNVGPWCRLPLTIRWLEKDYFREFHESRKPPDHMIIRNGQVKSKKRQVGSQELIAVSTFCKICHNPCRQNEELKCLNSVCDFNAHINCLADQFSTSEEYIPIGGVCPSCSTFLLWGDLIRSLKGISTTTNSITQPGDSDDSQSSDTA